MATVRPNISSIQDMPPKGGFPKINIARGVRPRGPSGLVIWATVLGMSTYGMIKINATNKDHRREHKEKREGRMAILPFLQAEADRAYSIQLKENLEKEAEIMKDVPGWVVGESTYSKRWNHPISRY